MSVTCRYCNAIITKNSLSRHQRSKKCLESQGKVVPSDFECEICLKRLTTQSSLNIHYDTHSTVLALIEIEKESRRETEVKLKDAKREIQELRSEIEELKKRHRRPRNKNTESSREE